MSRGRRPWSRNYSHAVCAELVEAPSFCGASRKNGPSTSSGRTDEGELSFVSRVPHPLAADRRRDLRAGRDGRIHQRQCRTEEHTSELKSLIRSSYAVFCLKKKNKKQYSMTVL